MRKLLIISLSLLFNTLLCASGGYDNGTPAGKGNIDIDITINPGNMFDEGQSYLVWGYGITDDDDFHGYVSDEASGTTQIYAGWMHRFFTNDWIDLSTAVGFRYRDSEVHVFLPQLLYTLKVSGYDIVGSVVNVYNITESKNKGVTYDIAFRIPIVQESEYEYLKSLKLSIGVFKNASGNL